MESLSEWEGFVWYSACESTKNDPPRGFGEGRGGGRAVVQHLFSIRERQMAEQSRLHPIYIRESLYWHSPTIAIEALQANHKRDYGGSGGA